MENLKIAIDLESHAKEYFTSLADKCHYNEGVRYILSMLANEQSLLINTIENRIKNISVLVDDSEFFQAAKTVFYELKMKISEFSCEIDHLNLYRHAQDLMMRAHALYEDKAAATTGEIKSFWAQIAQEKRKQLILLDNIIELLLRPEQWVESSEFTRLEDY